MTEDAKAEALRLAKEAGFALEAYMEEWTPSTRASWTDFFVRLVALARAPQSGWVMVPKEPTDAMIQAMQASMYDDGPVKRGHIEYALWEQVYGDLLAAASQAQPEPPAGWVQLLHETRALLAEWGEWYYCRKDDAPSHKMERVLAAIDAAIAAAPNAQEK